MVQKLNATATLRQVIGAVIVASLLFGAMPSIATVVLTNRSAAAAIVENCEQVEALKTNVRQEAVTSYKNTVNLVKNGTFRFPGLSDKELLALTKKTRDDKLVRYKARVC